MPSIDEMAKDGLVVDVKDTTSSVLYPVIGSWRNEGNILDNPLDGELELYVHVPFCNYSCSFCHYYILTGLTAIRKGEPVSDPKKRQQEDFVN